MFPCRLSTNLPSFIQSTLFASVDTGHLHSTVMISPLLVTIILSGVEARKGICGGIIKPAIIKAYTYFFSEENIQGVPY